MQSHDLSLHPLLAVSVVDGRHALETRPLQRYFSEFALMRYRLYVEVNLLAAYAAREDFAGVRRFSAAELHFLHELVRTFSLEDAMVIQDLDRFGYQGAGPLNHDVLAMETWLKQQLAGSTLADVASMCHFGWTAEDLNNLAFNMMFCESLRRVFIPAVITLCDQLAQLAERYQDTPMLGITHAQPAAPTTFGKEMGNFLARLQSALESLRTYHLTGMLSGNVGTYGEIAFAAPGIDWIVASSEIIAGFGMQPNLMTTQVEPHNNRIGLMSILAQICNVVRDLCGNIYLYSLLGVLKQKPQAHEASSSTMPYKINPWQSEVARGRLMLAMHHIYGMIDVLGTQNLQRTLEDHEPLRSMGEVVANLLVGVSYASDQMTRFDLNEEAVQQAMGQHDKLLATAHLAALQLHGQAGAYDAIKVVARGQEVSAADLMQAIRGQGVPDDVETRLAALTLSGYTGYAGRLTAGALEQWRQIRVGFRPGIQAVLWDFDLTLVLGEHQQTRARNRLVCEYFGFELTPDQKRELEFKGYGATLTYLAARASEHIDQEVTARDVTERINRVYNQIDGELELNPEALPVLQALAQAGVRQAVVTDRGRVSTPYYLAHFGLTDLLPVQVNQGTCPHRKPHPAPLLQALRALGVKPQHVLYVGNEAKDMEAARAAGCIPVSYGGCPLHFRPGVLEFQITSLAEVPQLIAMLS